jgi:hypothetical protein
MALAGPAGAGRDDAGVAELYRQATNRGQSHVLV